MISRSRGVDADFPLILYAVLLTTFGILMVYSAGQSTTAAGSSGANYWMKQLAFWSVGIVAAYAVSRVSSRVLEYLAWPAFLFACLLLLLTVVGLGSGAGTAEGTTSWLTIAGKRIGQPAELAKIAVVLLLAKSLASRREIPNTLFELWQPLAIVAIPGLLIVKQEDLGTALVFFALVFVMLFWAGVRWQLLVFLASPIVSLVLAGSTRLWGFWFILVTLLLISHRPVVEATAVWVANITTGVLAQVLWERLSPYRQERLLTFMDPTADPLNAGYNVIQSMTAIGSGGWFGLGYNEGTQKALSFIPEQHTDFIFAVLGEELGFVGVCLALSLFLALLLRTTRIASRSHDAFAGLVAIGLTSIWFTHIVVNVGMTLSLVPVTGIPLPFFSYGGSFLLACWLCVGIVHRISVEGRGQPDSTAL